MKTQMILALKFLFAMIILTGIIYPLFMADVAQAFFSFKANGSLIKKDGLIVGSTLIGQQFDSSIYFSSRPSATGYNPIPSSGSNLGPTSDKLKKLTIDRRTEFIKFNSILDTANVPNEMIFASGSGLDPHISPQAAFMQMERVAATRNFNEEQKIQLRKLIENTIEPPQFFLLGEPRINVFKLNLAIDNIQ
jgi:K+-transporting ATPase ATPase C chain